MMRAIKQFESPYVQYLSITLQQNSVRYFFLVPKIAPGEVRKKCIFKWTWTRKIVCAIRWFIDQPVQTFKCNLNKQHTRGDRVNSSQLLEKQ